MHQQQVIAVVVVAPPPATPLTITVNHLYQQLKQEVNQSLRKCLKVHIRLHMNAREILYHVDYKTREPQIVNKDIR